MTLAYFVDRAPMSREGAIKFYDAFPSVRRLYQDIAAWTGESQEQIMADDDLPDEHGPRKYSMLAIRSIAIQIAVNDVLAAEGVFPQLAVGVSLGISAASAMIGTLSRPELFGLLWHRRYEPESPPDGPVEGIAFCHLAADSGLDRFLGKERDGIYVAVDFGTPPNGLGRNFVLSGYKSALEGLAAEDPNVKMGKATTAKHSPIRKPVSDFIREYVSKLTFRDPVIPLSACLDDRLLTTADEVREAICRSDSQLASVPAGITQAINAGTQMFLVLAPSAVEGIVDFQVPVLTVREPADIETAVTAVNRLRSDLSNDARQVTSR
jgi:[acyl-carrier-protein] S-malonyltransferase